MQSRAKYSCSPKEGGATPRSLPRSWASRAGGDLIGVACRSLGCVRRGAIKHPARDDVFVPLVHGHRDLLDEPFAERAAPDRR